MTNIYMSVCSFMFHEGSQIKMLYIGHVA